MTALPADGSLPGMVYSAVQQQAEVVEQVQLARDTYRLRLACPEIAEQIVPGQFFMVRSPSSSDPLLGRPFALFDTYENSAGRPAGVDFGYVVIGKLTRLMRTWKPGDRAEIWGPLGNGFPLPTGGHLMFIAGGIGQTPFLATAREALGLRRYGRPAREIERAPQRLSMCYGVRSAEYLAGLADFDLPGLTLKVATDDGSYGHHGLVTDLLTESLGQSDPPTAIYCCGPEPMMEAVAAVAEQHNVDCWLSLETPMACGFGACFSCVTRVRLPDGGWDYRRVCVEGPVFPARQLKLSKADGTPSV